MDRYEPNREIKPEKYEIIELNNYSEFFTLIAFQVAISVFFCIFVWIMLKVSNSTNKDEFLQFISYGFIFGLGILFFLLFLFIIFMIVTWIKDKVRVLDINEYNIAITEIERLYNNDKISKKKMFKTADSLKKSHDKFSKVKDEKENNIKNLKKKYLYSENKE